MGVVAAVAAVAGMASSYVGQKKAAKEASKRAREASAARQRAEALQKRREDIQAARQRRRSAAEARRFKGQAVNRAALQGAGGAIGAQGSTVPGVSANLQSQLNFNNAFTNRVTELNAGIRSAFGQAQDIANRPITAGSGLMAFGSLLSTVSSVAGNFKSPTTTPSSYRGATSSFGGVDATQGYSGSPTIGSFGSSYGGIDATAYN